jgi:hypothetical protein
MIKIREQAYRYYFFFIQERMNIFWKRLDKQKQNLTEDEILKTYKFTNVYRVLDRVTQYLIQNVIYKNLGDFTEEDILLRILVFKIFNKIETWEFIESSLGCQISVRTFDVDRISQLLTQRIKEAAIFNPAYMMTGSHAKYNSYNAKHEKWLRMVEKEFIGDRLFGKLIKAPSMASVYEMLREKSFIGGFLAYQYTIDFNYSPVIDFDENSFVKAGIGSIRGIKKCFYEDRKYSYEDLIRYTQENFDFYQDHFGYSDFKNLFGRQPTLIDLQNCFCETDKYLRVKMPELQVDNIKIKQKYRANPKLDAISYMFPPKWNLSKLSSTNDRAS